MRPFLNPEVLCYLHLYAKWDIYQQTFYKPNLYTPNGIFIRQIFIRQIFIRQIFIRQICIRQMRHLYAKREFYTPSGNIYPPNSGVAGVRSPVWVGQALHSKHAGRRANIISWMSIRQIPATCSTWLLRYNKTCAALRFTGTYVGPSVVGRRWRDVFSRG